MRSYRKKQVLTLSILFIAVLTLSIGFSAFSSNLKIKSTATVNPDLGNFNVKFSTTQDSLTVSDVEPYSITAGLSATNGIIDNSATPTISNLSATFTKPGDYVTYRFYVRNEGGYIAYLNSIMFNSEKKCTAKAGTNEAMAQAACEDIVMSVTVGDVTATETTLNIVGETVNPKEGKLIEIKVQYLSNGAISDGDFSIEFSDISLYYGSTTGLTAPLDTKCTSKTVAVSGSYTSGDLYSCNVSTSESYDFYVLNDNMDGTVTMLMADDLVSLTSWNEAMSFLNTRTSSWTLPNSVSMPTAEQIGCSEDPYDNGNYCSGKIPSYAQGYYWTTTDWSGEGLVYLFVNGNRFSWAEAGGYYLDGTEALYGIRPIITVDKTKLN